VTRAVRTSILIVDAVVLLLGLIRGLPIDAWALIVDIENVIAVVVPVWAAIVILEQIDVFRLVGALVRRICDAVSICVGYARDPILACSLGRPAARCLEWVGTDRSWSTADGWRRCRGRLQSQKVANDPSLWSNVRESCVPQLGLDAPAHSGGAAFDGNSSHASATVEHECRIEAARESVNARADCQLRLNTAQRPVDVACTETLFRPRTEEQLVRKSLARQQASALAAEDLSNATGDVFRCTTRAHPNLAALGKTKCQSHLTDETTIGAVAELRHEFRDKRLQGISALRWTIGFGSCQGGCGYRQHHQRDARPAHAAVSHVPSSTRSRS